ncbi:MAG: hypothetical protein AAGK32_13045, partial [Actinomycetota bacterium]
GVLLTAEALHAHDVGADPIRMPYHRINEVSLERDRLVVDGRRLVNLVGLADRDDRSTLVQLVGRLAGVRTDDAEDGAESEAPPPTGVLGPAVEIEWTMAPPAAVGETGNVHLSNQRGFEPGGEFSFVLQADPWPDPRLERVEIGLHYHSSYLGMLVGEAQSLAGQLLSTQGLQTVELSSGDGTWDDTVVAEGTIDADRIGADGRIAGSFTLPDPCPPTVRSGRHDQRPGYWALEGRFRRSRSRDRHIAALPIVLGAHPDALQASQRSTVGTPQDWLLRVVDHSGAAADPGLVDVGRPKSLAVEGTPTVATPGQAIQGVVRLAPDEHTIPALPRRRQEEARRSGAITVPSVGVALECWRGALARRTRQRMSTTGGLLVAEEVTVAIGEVAEVPFTLVVPESVQLTTTWPGPDLVAEVPCPLTFYGSAFASPVLDDIRWRVTAQVPADALDRSAPDGFAGGPFWAGAEILVARSPR